MIAAAALCTAASAPAQQAAPNRDDWLLNAPDDTARFRLLQNDARGFSMAMAETGQRYEKLHDAISDRNFDLAAYHWAKIRDAINAGTARRPGRKANADAAFTGKVYEPVMEALKSGDSAKAWAGFAQARAACSICTRGRQTRSSCTGAGRQCTLSGHRPAVVPHRRKEFAASIAGRAKRDQRKPARGKRQQRKDQDQ